MTDIEAIIGVANSPDSNGVVFSEDALRTSHDGVRLFWDNHRHTLFYRGPAEELKEVRATMVRSILQRYSKRTAK